jgi:hypothetical protein
MSFRAGTLNICGNVRDQSDAANPDADSGTGWALLGTWSVP